MSVLDDDVPAELAALRRRAYGPDADIERDPGALARLVELEDLARHEQDDVAVERPEPDVTREVAQVVSAAPLDPASHADPSPGYPRPVHRLRTDALPVDAPARRAGARWPVAVGGIAVATAIVFAAFQIGGTMQQQPPAAEATPDATGSATFDERTREAFTLVRDKDAQELLHIPLDGSFGNYIDLTADGTVPGFPSSGPTRWAALLGDYYGWELWIAGAAGTLQDEQCILVRKGDLKRSRCVPAALRETAALAVSVPYELLEPGERSAFSPGQRVGFLWLADEEVTVLLAQQPSARTATPSESPSG